MEVFIVGSLIGAQLVVGFWVFNLFGPHRKRPARFHQDALGQTYGRFVKDNHIETFEILTLSRSGMKIKVNADDSGPCVEKQAIELAFEGGWIQRNEWNPVHGQCLSDDELIVSFASHLSFREFGLISDLKFEVPAS